MLKGACLPAFLWDECMQATTYIYNRCIAPNSETMTPFEQLLGAKPNCGHLRAYGCVAYAYNFDISRKKLDDRGIKCILIGYDERSSAYKLYVPTTKKIIKSGHVAFNEFKTYYVIKDKDSALPDTATATVLSDDDSDANSEHIVEAIIPHVPVPTEDLVKANVRNNAISVESSTSSLSPVTHQKKRPKRSIKPIVRFMNLVSDVEPDIEFSPVDLDSDEIEMLLQDFDSSPQAPKSFEDIQNWDDQDMWYKSVTEENNSLVERNVFIQIDPSSLPPGINIVKCRYILKRKANGRYKARLIAKGFSQKYGVDYNKTFAPVVGKVSLRILLALAAVHDWEIHQLDVKTAFLYGELKEDIYVEAPFGLGSESSSSRTFSLPWL